MKLLKKDIDFVGHRKLYLLISAVIMLVGVAFNLIFGVQLDTEFKGGTLISYAYSGDIDRAELQALIQEKIGDDFELQYSTGGVDGNHFNITMADALGMEQQKALDSALHEKYPDHEITKSEATALPPTMGMMFFTKCLVAIAIASLFLLIYVAFRFRKIGGWAAGAMGLIALLHDVVVAYFVFVIFGIPLNENFVAVVLSILGYSLNDTIVIYDRVRENRRLMDSSYSLGDVVNRSINQSLTRSVITALSTFIAIGTVAVLAMIFRLESIVSFAFPMMVGVVSGCYSSVCICGPWYVAWKERKHKNDDKGGSKNGAAKKVKA